MSKFTDNEISRLIEQALDTVAEVPKEQFSGDPIDDPNNPDVPKGGRWGITGMGQTPEMFRTRVGSPGLNKSPSGKIKGPEVNALVKRMADVNPDEVIAYSRGAALYNLAVSQGAKPTQVTYMAPSSYRAWASRPADVPPAPAGSKVTIGDEDPVVPMKQAAKNAVAAGTPMYVLPGFSHTGIMYSRGDVTPGGFEVDPEEILADPEMPDWGATGSAAGGKSGEVMTKQRERVKQHVKERKMIEDFVKILLSR